MKNLKRVPHSLLWEQSISYISWQMTKLRSCVADTLVRDAMKSAHPSTCSGQARTYAGHEVAMRKPGADVDICRPRNPGDTLSHNGFLSVDSRANDRPPQE